MKNVVADIIDSKFLLYISNLEHLAYLYWYNNHLRYLNFFLFFYQGVSDDFENNIF